MTRYLLFGATGYLGGQVRRALLHADRGDYVVAVSGHPSGRRPDPPACDWQQLDLVRASVADVARLVDYAKPDVVVNGVGRTVGSSEELEAVNVSVVRKLLDALIGSGPVRLIHLGTAAEYGRQPRGVALAESAPPRPTGDYGRTKLVATDLVMERVAQGELTATVLRVFDPVGPGAPEHSLVGAAVRAIARAVGLGASFVTLEQLSSCRDFVAGADVAATVLRAAGATDLPPLLNVGRGVATSGRSLVELLAAAAGFEGDIFGAEGGGGEAQSPVWQQADLTLLRRHLQWVPTTSMAEAVGDLWPGTATGGPPPRRWSGREEVTAP